MRDGDKIFARNPCRLTISYPSLVEGCFRAHMPQNSQLNSWRGCQRVVGASLKTAAEELKSVVGYQNEQPALNSFRGADVGDKGREEF